MLSRYDDKVIAFVLRERQTAFPRYLAGRLRHALITGSTLDERNAKTVKRMFWGWIILIAVFATGAVETFLGTSPNAPPEGGLSSKFFREFAMAMCFALMLFVNHVILVGLRNKEKVPVDLSIPPFNREAVTSGGIWAAAAMGLIALYSHFFG